MYYERDHTRLHGVVGAAVLEASSAKAWSGPHVLASAFASSTSSTMGMERFDIQTVFMAKLAVLHHVKIRPRAHAVRCSLSSGTSHTELGDDPKMDYTVYGTVAHSLSLCLFHHRTMLHIGCSALLIPQLE